MRWGYRGSNFMVLYSVIDIQLRSFHSAARRAKDARRKSRVAPVGMTDTASAARKKTREEKAGLLRSGWLTDNGKGASSRCTPKLLVAEGDEGVDLNGAARWDVTGQKRDCDQ